MKNKFSPATDTLAVMTLRGTSEPVAKLAITQDAILLTLIVSIVRGILTPYRESHITLKAGQTVYFVASEREGYSYIVFLYADGTSLCSCKDGCQHKACQHAADADAYEARLEVEDRRRIEEAQAYEIACATACVRSANRREAGKNANLLERKKLRNGNTLYIFQSSRSGYKYFITTDTATGTPDSATHQDCEGYHYKGRCCHMDAVLASAPARQMAS